MKFITPSATGVVVVGMSVLGPCVTLASAQRQTTETSQPIVSEIDGAVPRERTLAEAFADTEALIRVQIVGEPEVVVFDMNQAYRLTNPAESGAPVVVTTYQARVVEVFKSSERLGVTNAIITVGYFGGQSVWQGRAIITKSNSSPLTRGSEYLLFLKYRNNIQAFMTEFHEVFDIANGKISDTRPGRTTRFGRALVGQQVAEIQNIIEAARTGVQ